MSDHPLDHDARLRRLLGDAEPGDEALLVDREMHRLIDLLDEIDPDDQLEEPPPGLWDRIAEESGVSEVEPTGEEVPVEAETEAPGKVVPLRARPPWWLGAVAAALVLVALAVAVIAIATVTTGDDPEQVAVADLELLLDAEATGAATLVQRDDALVLELDVAGLDEIDGYYEVWLLTPAVDGLVSLGPLRSDGRHELPSGLDHTEYVVVDISIEPHDGDPTHSGNSILRGELTEA